MSFNRTAAVLASLLAGASLVLAAASVSAQVRTLPANAKRAELSGYQNPYVVLGGEARRLAPGARIFDAENRTITPGYLPAQADVVYTLDPAGSVMRIYLLTPQERQRLDAARR